MQDRIRRGATILTYHRVVDSLAVYPRGHPFSGLVVGKREFADQLDFLSRNYEVIALTELVERLERLEDTRRCVVLTFDDGYLDNLTNALPLLEHFQTPATIFITSGLIDRVASLWWFELEYLLAGSDSLYTLIARYAAELKQRSPTQQTEILVALRGDQRVAFSYDQLMLTWDQVRQLASNKLITLGAHTVRHSVLSKLAQDELRSELLDGRSQLEQQIHKNITLFSYPYGSRSEAGTREYDAVTSSGYRAAVTTVEGHCVNVRPNALPRITVDCTDTLSDFAWKLSGFYASRLKVG